MDDENLQRAQESAVGISVSVRPDVPGFNCIVKQRYTDFLVNEISPEGRVLHLTELSQTKEGKRKRDDNADVPSKKIKPELPAEHVKIESERDEVPIQPDAIPAAPSLPQNADQITLIKAKKEAAIASISDTDQATLKDLFGAETTDAILNLYASVATHPDRKPRDHPTVISKPLAEKSQRTEAHMCIRRIFQSKLETLTIQDGDHQSGPGTTISIKAAPRKGAANPNPRNGEQQQRGKQNWSDLGGEYLHFTVYKENKDTMEVLGFIAAQLKMHIKHFGFAGTKDRRGVTVQRVSAHRIKRERIEGLNRLARGWRAGGPWEYKPDGIDLGMLCGNQFLLTLRDARPRENADQQGLEERAIALKASAELAAKSLSESGFLNYFGLQRFGTHSTGTHTVGMKMLQGDLSGAVNAILWYDPALLEDNKLSDGQDTGSKQSLVPQDDINRARAINSFRTLGTSAEALNSLPGGRFSGEKSLITHLGKKDRKTGDNPNKNDYQGALMAIQKNLRLMYVHAYQSFVWNTVAGKRWETFGKQVVEGDLVVVGEKERQEGTTNGKVAEEEVDEDGEPIIHPSASLDPNAPFMPGEIVDPFVRARPLSKEEAASGRYTIFDIVLPLPGFDVVYPKNEIGKFYEHFMGSDEGGRLDPHNMRRSWKDISLSGDYRKMMARPLGRGVEVEVKAYGDVDEQLVQTDLEKLEEANGGVEKTVETGKESSTTEKNKLAVILKMQLGSSQYATMALRELTKGGAVGFTPNYSVANR